MKTAGVILAAGEGRRFGSAKQLAELDGRPLLQHVVDAALAAPALGDVVVVLGAHAEAITGALNFGAVRVVRCEDWAEGMAASLRVGVAALAGDVSEVVVLLGDQPGVSGPLIERLVDAAHAHGKSSPARAAYNGVPGHPVLLRGPVLESITTLHGDIGARDLLAAHDVQLVEVSDLGEIVDIDAPQQLRP